MSFEIIMIVIFVLGYLAIALEHNLHIDKAAPALIIGVATWAILITNSYDYHEIEHALVGHHLGEVAQILFFLLGAMTIVETIDMHDGFSIITKRIKTRNKTTLLWIISLVTFFLSAALDNLATTIVMVSMLRKILEDKNDRLFYVSMVVIAANAGGAWSPIGDVTTTMLWIGGQVSTTNIILTVFLPSIVCLLVPLSVASLFVKGEMQMPDKSKLSGGHGVEVPSNERNLVFTVGVLGLIFVPIFKTWTHLPPFMGISLVLGIIWGLTEILHKDKSHEEKRQLSVIGVLGKVDMASVLFFLGILLAVTSLQTAGVLKDMATWLDQTVSNIYIIGFILGLLSAIVDNVPLVAAAMGMYDLNVYPQDHVMWEFIAYCAGTGGSTLIIGSAAGVAAMGMESINFMWYLKKVSWLAILGYIAGAAAFILQHYLLTGSL